MHVDGAHRPDRHDGGGAGPEQIVAGLHRGQHRSNGCADRARKHGDGVLKQRIDQRHVGRRRQSLAVRQFLEIGQLHEHTS
jgi:hypothetical protein